MLDDFLIYICSVDAKIYRTEKDTDMGKKEGII